MRIGNDKYRLDIDGGAVSGLYSDVFGETNLALKNGKSGRSSFTLLTDDITKQERDKFTPYMSRNAEYDRIEKQSEGVCTAYDSRNGITTRISVEESGVRIYSAADNENISEFGLNFELNFLGRKGSHFSKQLIPTSPYTSSDNRYLYYIMTNPEGKLLLITAKTECDGWKLDYSPQCCGHYILNLKLLASFDRVYGGSGKKEIEVSIRAAESLERVFELAAEETGVPVCRPLLGGGFDGTASVKVCGDYDYFRVTSPSGKVFDSRSNVIRTEEYGFYSVAAVSGDTVGADCVLWSGGDMAETFNKSCEAIRKPYHNDDNLCEGGCFLWAMLANMNFGGSLKFDSVAKEELDVIMAKGDFVPHRTIVPQDIDGVGEYHIYDSVRVQEQFFGVSILIEAYKLYRNKEIYEYMVMSLMSLVKNHIKDGMIFNGSDYTTVCAPMLPIVDAVKLMKSEKDERYIIFEKTADEVAEYLFKRQYNFPTEGETSDLFDTEYEDGSISCTALSLLYYCRYVRRNEAYESFAKDVLKLHEAWTIYSPDVRMNNSSFRWWETIWEGDGEGPSICCGHAWTVWKGEALFHGGELFKDDKMMLESWNAYLTNFCKTQEDGRMFCSYEVDYIRGGGEPNIKRDLRQLMGEDLKTKYEIAHSYPKHYDNSLSRYAWVRAYYTWLKTAAVLMIDGEVVAVNAEIDGNVIKTKDYIENVYLSDALEQELVFEDGRSYKKII